MQCSGRALRQIGLRAWRLPAATALASKTCLCQFARRQQHTAARPVAAKASKSFAGADSADALLSGAAPWPSYLGPLSVQDTPGKGRGLVATRDVEAGELLIVCPPLAYATAGEGEVPDAEELVER